MTNGTPESGASVSAQEELGGFRAPAVKANPYEKIRDAIASGELEPGQPLVESSLATWCGVSRTPVREALRRLEQDGLVAWSERGLGVRKRTPEEILDIYDVRIVLEAQSARTAADRRTDRDLVMLHASLSRGGAVDPSDVPAKVIHSRSFHQLVRRAAHNEALIDLLDRISLHLSRYADAQPTLAASGRWEAAMHEYSQLVNAIERRDGPTAYDISHRYFSEARDLRVAMFVAETSD